MQETQVRLLGWEDPLEKEMAIHSHSCLENPMDRGLAGYSPRGYKSWTWLSNWKKKWKVYVPYDPAIPLLGIHTEETRIERDVYPNVCETAKETQMYRTVFWTLWERVRVAWFGRMALKHVYYHIWKKSPVQVRCMGQGARGWCTGMTQRDGMGREVGGGFRMGSTCTPVADSCQCMAKPIQYCKVISLQLKEINLYFKKLKKKEKSRKWKCSCSVSPTLCDPMVCSLPGSSILGIF